jgi:hypothetical protein
VPNKARQKTLDEMAEKGIETPLAYMLRILADKTVDHERRDWAAEKAAPYLYSKLSAIEANVNLNLSFGVALESLKKRNAPSPRPPHGFIGCAAIRCYLFRKCPHGILVHFAIIPSQMTGRSTSCLKFGTV